MAKLSSLLIVLILLSSSLFSQSKLEKINSGAIIEFNSKILNEQKVLFVHLPKDYKTKSYPVLYVISSLAHDFRADIYRDQSIVVGIENKDPRKYFVGENNRKDYLQFLNDELIPFVEAEFNASSTRYISGHSISGGFVMDVLMQSPDSFSFYAATSPCIHMLNESTGITAPTNPTFLYFNIGSRENYEQLEQANKAFNNTLDSLNLPKLKWKFELLADETHETNEFTGFCRANSFLQSFSSIPDHLLSQNIHAILEYADEMNDRLGNKMSIGESVFMPNILINLNTENYQNVVDAMQYIAKEKTEFFVAEAKTMTDIADELRKKGSHSNALKAYQLIYNKTKKQEVLEKIKEMEK
jgi:predicted alpha/beta superfamily hydrolase